MTWTRVENIRMVAIWSDKVPIAIKPDARNAVAIDIYFIARDGAGTQLDTLSRSTLQKSIVLTDGSDGTPLKKVSSTDDIKSADCWFYTSDPDLVVRSGIDWDDGSTHSGDKGDGGNQTPIEEKNFQYLRFYVGCGFEAPRHMSLGVQITTDDGTVYKSHQGANGPHTGNVWLEVNGDAPPFDPRVSEGDYYIAASTSPGMYMHPQHGANTTNNEPIVLWGNNQPWARWKLTRNSDDTFFIQNVDNGQFYMYSGGYAWASLASGFMNKDVEYKFKFKFHYEYYNSEKNCYCYRILMPSDNNNCLVAGDIRDGSWIVWSPKWSIGDSSPGGEWKIQCSTWYLIKA